MPRICGPFVLKTIILNHFSFRETLGFFSCATHSLDLCILFELIFYTSGYIPPHSCDFYTFCLQQLFHMYSTMRNIFLFLHDALD